MKPMSGLAWKAAVTAILATACASAPAYSQHTVLHHGGGGESVGDGPNGLGFGMGHRGYGVNGLDGSGLLDPGYGGYGGFGGIGVGGMGYTGAHLGRYNLNYYSGYGGPGTMLPQYSFSGPFASLPPNSTVPYLLDLYNGRYEPMPPNTPISAPVAEPYLTSQTYEPGDGRSYPLYYNPATSSYVYYPTAQ